MHAPARSQAPNQTTGALCDSTIRCPASGGQGRGRPDCSRASHQSQYTHTGRRSNKDPAAADARLELCLPTGAKATSGTEPTTHTDGVACFTLETAHWDSCFRLLRLADGLTDSAPLAALASRKLQRSSLGRSSAPSSIDDFSPAKRGKGGELKPGPSTHTYSSAFPGLLYQDLTITSTIINISNISSSISKTIYRQNTKTPTTRTVHQYTDYSHSTRLYSNSTTATYTNPTREMASKYQAGHRLFSSPYASLSPPTTDFSSAMSRSSSHDSSSSVSHYQFDTMPAYTSAPMLRSSSTPGPQARSSVAMRRSSSSSSSHATWVASPYRSCLNACADEPTSYISNDDLLCSTLPVQTIPNPERQMQRELSTEEQIAHLRLLQEQEEQQQRLQRVQQAQQPPCLSRRSSSSHSTKKQVRFDVASPKARSSVQSKGRRGTAARRSPNGPM